MDDEYKSLIDNKTWEACTVPLNWRPLSRKWVFKHKLGSNGQIVRYKAHFVAQGFQQLHRIDFNETYASVVKPPAYKLFFWLAAYSKLHIHQLDIKTAFLYGDIDEEIYLNPPEGYPQSGGKALKLLKAIYGLKQSPRQWYHRLQAYLEKIGWKTSQYDSSVFFNSDTHMFLTVYVDDILVFGSQQQLIEEFRGKLKEEFDVSDIRKCVYYLGMQVKQDTKTGDITLYQSNYIQQILERFNLKDIQPVSSPLDSTKLTSPDDKDYVANEQFKRTYQGKIGSLNYLMVVTRFDIAYAVGLVSRYASNPTTTHMKAVDRIFAYLKKTHMSGIQYFHNSVNDNLQGYADSDWAGCLDTRRSTTGWMIRIGGAPISWQSKRQRTVALSSCEAEYMAAAECSKEIMWLIGIMNELKLPGIPKGGVPLFIDNEAALKLTKNPELHARTKHIDIRYHFIREQVQDGKVAPTQVGTKANLADLLTKRLPRETFEELATMSGLQEVEGQGDQDYEVLG